MILKVLEGLEQAVYLYKLFENLTRDYEDVQSVASPSVSGRFQPKHFKHTMRIGALSQQLEQPLMVIVASAAADNPAGH